MKMFSPVVELSSECLSSIMVGVLISDDESLLVVQFLAGDGSSSPVCKN